MILAHNAQMGQKDAYQLTLSIAEASGLYRFFKEDKSIEGQSRAANVEELINSAKAFVEEQHNTYIEDKMVAGEINDADEISEENLPLVTLGDYLENISLLSAVDVSDEESSNKVALMTVHSAKGLEFPYVYIAGCEENLFPGGGMLASPAEIEEERRLFYVALTRAQKVVDLSFATTRMRNGKHESNAPSRFVKEINPSFISNPLGRDDDGDVDDGPFVRFDRKPSFGGGRPSFGGPKPSFGASRPQQVQPAKPAFRPAPAPAAAADFQPDPIHSFQAGMQVEHNRFGFGQILEISGDPSDLKAKIRFQSYGEKLLLLKYAKMRIVKK